MNLSLREVTVFPEPGLVCKIESIGNLFPTYTIKVKNQLLLNALKNI
jgi:hypothetical protein